MSSSKALLTILVGPSTDQKTMHVPVSVLSRSPVFSEWIANPETIPVSLKTNGFIHFRAFGQPTVQAALHFLGEELDGKVVTWGSCPLNGLETASDLLRIYKFGKNISAQAPCYDALARLSKRISKASVEEFVAAVITIGHLEMAEDEVIAQWMSIWLDRNMEFMENSATVQQELVRGGVGVWPFAMALMFATMKLGSALRDKQDNGQENNSAPYVSGLRDLRSELELCRKKLEKLEKLEKLSKGPA